MSFFPLKIYEQEIYHHLILNAWSGDTIIYMIILNSINVVELSKLYITDMYRKGYGKILNVSSTGVFQLGSYTSTYYASKVFVLSYSRAII